MLCNVKVNGDRRKPSLSFLVGFSKETSAIYDPFFLFLCSVFRKKKYFFLMLLDSIDIKNEFKKIKKILF
jgi:hypothetical protein